MKLSDHAKPIEYLMSHTDQVIESLGAHKQPVVITVDGKPKAVLQDIGSYEKTLDAIAMLKVLLMGQQDVREGKTLLLEEAFRKLREEVRKD